MFVAFRNCFPFDSTDETGKLGRRGLQSRKQVRQPPNDENLSENKTARRIQSAGRSTRTLSESPAYLPTSNHKTRNEITQERPLRTSQGQVPFDSKCNEGRYTSSSSVATVRPTPGIESGKGEMFGRVLIPRHLRVPSVVYVSPARPPTPSTRRPRTRPSGLNGLPRLELLDNQMSFAIDASTISASPSTHSLYKDEDLECHDQQNKSARFGESDGNDSAAPRPPQRQPSRKPIQNARIYVPSRDGMLRLSPPKTLAHTFSRPSSKIGSRPATKTGDAPETSSRAVQLLPTRKAQKLAASPSPASRSASIVIHPVPHISRTTRSTAPKITVVSEEFKIFVIDLLSDEHCDWVLQCAKQHTASAALSGRETWRKIYTHTCLDLPCCEISPLRPLTNNLLVQVRQIAGKTWNARRAASGLVPRSWKEPHLLCYQKTEGQPENDHTGMIMHHDGGDLSWQLMLSQQKIDYNGGGTYFRCLRKTIMLKKGQVLVHPGNLYHRGVDITSGTRTLMVCFMDGYDLKVNDPSNLEDDSVEFQRNILTV